MKKPFKILLATDYSEAAQNAERYAIHFALQTGSFLEILHVYQAPIRMETDPTVFGPEKIEYHPEELELRKLKEHTTKLLNTLRIDPRELKFDCAVREGNAAKQICDEGKELGFDFIIVGSHGKSGFKQFLLGNHTWDVMKAADLPVLAIPQNAFFSGIKNVVYLTEYRDAEIPSIDFLSQFVSQFNAEIIVLNLLSIGVSSSYEEEISIPFLKKLKEKVRYPNLTIRTMHYEDIVEDLNKFCLKTQADWIASSIEKTSFLERIFSLNPSSLTKKMVIYTHTPFLILHDSFKEEEELQIEKTAVENWAIS